MFTFDRKPGPSATYPPAGPMPASQRPVKAPPVTPAWFRLAASRRAGAVASPEAPEARRLSSEPAAPLSGAGGSIQRACAACSEDEARVQRSAQDGGAPIADHASALVSRVREDYGH